jgi:hypothetical protein
MATLAMQLRAVETGGGEASARRYDTAPPLDD